MNKLLLAALIFFLSISKGLAQQPNIILMLADDKY